jgi:hypothetical protein
MSTEQLSAPAAMPSVKEEAAAILARLGVHPDERKDRRSTAAMLTSAGFPTSPQTLANYAARRVDAPPHQLYLGRAIYRARSSMEWAIARASKPRHSSFKNAAA